MKMTEMPLGGQPAIDGYGPGGFRIGGVWREGAMLVSPEGVTPLADPADGIAQLAGIEAGAVDIVILGQGPEIGPVPRDWRLALEQAGHGVEHMATPAACRTYNVLLSEDRRVAALLLPV
ncbi:MAG: Mth938-like domain-containing protein [Pseudomonadota bacterium]